MSNRSAIGKASSSFVSCSVLISLRLAPFQRRVK